MSSKVAKSVADAVRVSFGTDGFATLTLNRASVHNALSDHVIAECRQKVEEVRQAKPRALFVKAEGKSFCAGADLDWMKRAATYTKEANIKDAMELTGLLKDINTLPLPTVAMVQGAALGGGVGIISVCDIAIGVQRAKFTLSEVKLGLIPATISPYVVSRIGATQSRRYFLSAETFDAPQARNIGLLHEVVEDQAGLDAYEQVLKEHFARNGPGAVTASKELINAVVGKEIDEGLMFDTATRLANQRDTDECREGINAFFEKRQAAFVEKI
mmetsp:Transcript_67/g.150  ORF Transcript_67/g.150 Transcript_67/m.150 type:complete len:272 (+) Transcript_67:301-1116(+)|eukprot:CAMPEP_0203743898 /NCGR_PEP_ID=MMETSP0098-20131031/147_1 /ASSEMBLY_ACC=CAM_ASM_000208 /TAXON_ID=96639 /ORGANISM=" , Strain NY0313808BC1" /LENGTH=271 /DNA_ID=CAMNT_0050631251 /DNA_START=260 /DNA_END=1075 /DNA_ORIENTATION=+